MFSNLSPFAFHFVCGPLPPTDANKMGRKGKVFPSFGGALAADRALILAASFSVGQIYWGKETNNNGIYDIDLF